MNELESRFKINEYYGEVYRSLPEDIRKKSDALIQNIEQDREGLNLDAVNDIYADYGLVPDLGRIVIYNVKNSQQVVSELENFSDTETNIASVQRGDAFFAPNLGVTLIPRDHQLEEINQGTWITEREIAHEAWHAMILPYQKFSVLRRWNINSLRWDLVFRNGFSTINPNPKDGNPIARGNFIEEGSAETMAYRFIMKNRPQDSIDEMYNVYLRNKVNPKGLDEKGFLRYRREIEGETFRYKVPFELLNLNKKGELQTYVPNLAASALLMIYDVVPELENAVLKTRSEQYMAGITETMKLINSISPGLYNKLATLKYSSDRTDFIKGLNIVMKSTGVNFD